jgi:hypothetical protein
MFVLCVVGLTCLGVCVVLLVKRISVSWTVPRQQLPEHLIRWHRTDLEAYVDSIYRQRIQEAPHGLGFPLLDVMEEYEIRSVKMNEGCVVIRFGTWPSEPSVVLIHSPTGKQGLPPHFNDPHSNWLYHLLYSVDEHWFVCVWDY